MGEWGEDTVSTEAYAEALDAMADALLRVRRLAVDADALAVGWNLDPQQILDVLPDFSTPDGPRRWVLPDEPGPEVTAVRGGSGTIYRRAGPHWQDGPRRGVESWWEILADGPLTDATPAADGQGGDGHG
jgi:hypothetical protein